ncbi:MAG: hypothetical protein AAB433_10275 [Nitrospirota bacterium]|nr:hypothetical protein [Nitrospira sp.]HRB16900.1 hypothetical protein [Nitrospira sp.]
MKKPGWKKWKKAAVVLLFAGAGLFTYSHYLPDPQQPPDPLCEVTASQIGPECPQATSIEDRIHNIENALIEIVADLQQLSDHLCPPDEHTEEDPIKKQLEALKHNLITSLYPSDTTHSDEVIIRVIQSRLERLHSYNDKVTHQILESGTIRPASKAEVESLVERLDTRLKQLVDEFTHPPDFSHHHATLETFHETMEGLIEVVELLKNLC